MGDSTRGQRRVQLARKIEEKFRTIDTFKKELEDKKKSTGNSVDDQIAVAELEYKLVKEEMALLNLQEQHWESAALWDANPHTPDIQKEVREVLHSYIASVREKGSIPALHASEYPIMENAVLVSSQSDKPSMPRVEWAHPSTELLPGDRLLEVNGHLVMGEDSSEVSRLLNAGRPLCRIVYLRPLSAHQLLKGNACREASNLRHELTSVVSRLNRNILENSKLMEQNTKSRTECEELKMQNRKLKFHVLSLQSILLYLYQTIDKNNHHFEWNNMHTELFQHQHDIFSVLKKTSCYNGPVLYSDILRDMLNSKKKSIPWLELSPKNEVNKHPSKSQDTLQQENVESR